VDGGKRASGNVANALTSYRRTAVTFELLVGMALFDRLKRSGFSTYQEEPSIGYVYNYRHVFDCMRLKQWIDVTDCFMAWDVE
jgi:hypothetical protein